MLSKATFRNALLNRGIVINRFPPAADICDLIRQFRSAKVGVELIRIGGGGDGGYLIPNDLGGIAHCFSPGVSDIADFEAMLASGYKIKSFMADASVDGPPTPNDLFSFQKKFLGAHNDNQYMTLSHWIESTEPETAGRDLLLQMDIEGGEYDVLIESAPETLRRFRIMVIEFHGLDMAFDHHGLRLLKPMFRKLHNDFAVAHMHPNNWGGIAKYNGVAIPRTLEVTYLRRDRIPLNKPADFVLPHPFDRTNLPHLPEVTMPPMWWR